LLYHFLEVLVLIIESVESKINLKYISKQKHITNMKVIKKRIFPLIVTRSVFLAKKVLRSLKNTVNRDTGISRNIRSITLSI